MRRLMWILTGALTAAAVLALVFPRTPSQPQATGADAPTSSPSASPTAELSPQVAGVSVEPEGSSQAPSSPGDDSDDNSEPPTTKSPVRDDPPRIRNRCPAAATCDRHEMKPGRWKLTGGKVRVEYWINPHEQQWFTPPYTEVVNAIRTAADTWMDAHPLLELVFRGITTDQPVQDGGKNVIGWMPLGPTDADQVGTADLARTSPFVDNDGFLVEVDTQINPAFPMEWTPCEQESGSCTDISYANPPRPYDLQNTMTHEFGHWLGLEDLDDERSVEQTMYENPEPGWRRQSTLALGDFCGLYIAYPGPDCEDSVVHVP